MLSKSVAIMNKRPSRPYDSHVYFQSLDDDTGLIVKSFSITMEAWRDFGEPEVMSMILEPGDILNG